MPDSNCLFCDTSVDKFVLQCVVCHYWVHYYCTNLPPYAYAIIQLIKSTRLLFCLTCEHERFKIDFPELHTQIEGAIKSQNEVLHLPVMSEIAVTQMIILKDHTMSYEERLNLYSIQRRRDRYQIIYLWKIIEKFVPNLSAPITCTFRT